MKLNLSEKVVDYFIQALFIFVSVFLAFWLNNYQAEQENIRLGKTKNITYVKKNTT